MNIAKQRNFLLSEIKINNPSQSLPPGWKEDAVDDFDIRHGIIRIFSAPMDGWDSEHEDSIHIIKADEDEFSDEDEFYIDINYAFGDTEELEEDYPTLISAIAKSINIMKKISKDWRK